ncbi:MAG: hypothetical protein FWC77_03975 [Defluviitaleaceae bacterium]|nr:hypothetical protein [Defluviitaleaceae bacterium]
MKTQTKRILLALISVLSLAAAMPFFIAHGSHGAAITGSVTVYNPARDVTVELHFSGGGVVSTLTVTPVDAATPVQFTFYDLPPGTYYIVFRQPGHTTFTFNDITITENIGVNLNHCENFPDILPLRPGNVTGSGQVNVADLVMMLQNWMGDYVNANPTATGQVNVADMSLLLQNWMAASADAYFTGSQEELPPDDIEQALQAAEDFLMQFPTIFMDTMPFTGGGLDPGQFHLGWGEIDGVNHPIISYEVPEIFFNRDTNGYYDNHGNRFAADTPWLSGGRHAVGFQLFDFNNSGIPYILISSSTGEFDFYGFFPHTLYRYIGAEFRRVYGGDASLHVNGQYGYTSLFPYTAFFLCPEDSVVGYAWNSVPGMQIGMLSLFSRISFDDDFANISLLAREWAELIGEYEYDRISFWQNYLTGEYVFDWPDPRAPGWSTDPDIVTYLPGTYLGLTPIAPLTTLQADITSRILERLYSARD